MTVFDSISLLETLDPKLPVVINDDQEPEPGHITELRAEYVRLCAIRYPHPDRTPKVARDGSASNAIFVGARMPG